MGPHHSNHCHRNLVRILSEIIKILIEDSQNSSEIQKFDEILTCSTEFGEIPRNFHQKRWQIGAVQTFVDLVVLEKMLKNAYLGAEIGFDAEEKEPSKVSSFGSKIGVKFGAESFN